MSAVIEELVDPFESRRVTRRELVASLTALIAGATAASSAEVSQAAQARMLNHASLAVADVERSSAFYSTLLGLKVVSRSGNGGINLGLGAKRRRSAARSA